MGPGLGGVIGEGAAAAAGAAPAIAAGATSSILGSVLPAVTGIAGTILKAVSGGQVNKSQQIPYPLTGDQASVAHGLAQNFGMNLGQQTLGSFGGYGQQTGGPLMQRVSALQNQLGSLLSRPPSPIFGSARPPGV